METGGAHWQRGRIKAAKHKWIQVWTPEENVLLTSVTLKLQEVILLHQFSRYCFLENRQLWEYFSLSCYRSSKKETFLSEMIDYTAQNRFLFWKLLECKYWLGDAKNVMRTMWVQSGPLCSAVHLGTNLATVSLHFLGRPAPPIHYWKHANPITLFIFVYVA